MRFHFSIKASLTTRRELQCTAQARPVNFVVVVSSNATKFPHPRLHIAVNPKAEPKKGTIKISPNKTLQSSINVATSPKIHVPVTAAIIRFNHNWCYTA